MSARADRSSHSGPIVVPSVAVPFILMQRTQHLAFLRSRAAPVRERLRELVISYGRTGYVALYRVAARGDRVEILAIRHQREAGYRS